MTNPNTPRPVSTVDDALARHGRLSYLEIPALDPPRSAAFYQKLLGWHIENPDSPSPKFQNPTADLIGRFAKTPTLSRDHTFVPYFYVDHLHDLLPLVAPLGGEIVTPLRPEGDLWIAIVRDPAGNLLGLWQDQAR
jgi:uncharacterized protein